MAASQLRIMHARAAEALEGRADPTLVPRLANHYLRAHVLGYHEQALRYAREAAGWPNRASPTRMPPNGSNARRRYRS